MPNVTVSLSDDLVEASRQYARLHRTSLNAMIREFLEKTVRRSERQWPDAFLAAVDEAHGDSHGWQWNRDEIYERDDRE